MSNYYPEDYKSKKDRMLEKEQEIKEIINTWYEKQHRAPSMKELAEEAGFKSTSTAHAYVKRMKEKGVVSWQDNKVRTLHVL